MQKIYQGRRFFWISYCGFKIKVQDFMLIIFTYNLFCSEYSNSSPSINHTKLSFVRVLCKIASTFTIILLI